MSTFEETVWIITGGASGIGRAVAERLAHHRAHCVLVDVQEELLEEAVEAVERRGGRASSAVVDVRDADAVRELVMSTAKEHGRLDVMFNNAGINVAGELRDVGLDDWNRLIDVNLRGVVHGVQPAYEIMREQGFGHIVNTASVAGLIPAIGEGAYAATKHAVVGLSTVLRAEARAFGVKVSVVCPGIIETPMIDTGKYVNVDRTKIRGALPMAPMPVGDAAKIILDGVANDEGIIVITRSAKALWWLNRFSPRGSDLLSRYVLRKLRELRIE